MLKKVYVCYYKPWDCSSSLWPVLTSCFFFLSQCLFEKLISVCCNCSCSSVTMLQILTGIYLIENWTYISALPLAEFRENFLCMLTTQCRKQTPTECKQEGGFPKPGMNKNEVRLVPCIWLDCEWSTCKIENVDEHICVSTVNNWYHCVWFSPTPCSHIQYSDTATFPIKQFLIRCLFLFLLPDDTSLKQSLKHGPLRLHINFRAISKLLVSSC